jgi:hypothetical protein
MIFFILCLVSFVGGCWRWSGCSNCDNYWSSCWKIWSQVLWYGKFYFSFQYHFSFSKASIFHICFFLFLFLFRFFKKKLEVWKDILDRLTHWPLTLMEEGTSIAFQFASFCVALYHIFKYEQIVDWLPTMLSFSLYCIY